MKPLLECITEHLAFNLKEQKEISAHFTSKSLKKGAFLLKSGQRAREMAYITSGYLRMYNTANGKEITLWIGSEASFITSLNSFIFESPNLWSIQAITDCEVQLIDRTSHFKLLKTIPKWMEFDNIILARAFAILENRLFSHLHTTAQERFQELLNQDPKIFKHVPLQYIASTLGVTPETLSRLRKNLSKISS